MERTDRVDIYAAAETHATEDAWGHPTTGAFGDPIASNVECNLQPIGGSVEQIAAGRAMKADWRGFFPTATALTQDMAIVVTAVRTSAGWVTPPVSQPKRFRVTQVGYQGEDWDTEALLELTPEPVPSTVAP